MAGETRRGGSGLGVGVFLGLVLLLAAGIGVWFVFFSAARPAKLVPQPEIEPQPNITGKSPDELRELVRRKNRALGWLDNEKLVEADPAFAALSAELPEEPLPARNLAVSRLLSLKSGRTEIAAAEQAVAEMLKREPESAAAWQLAGRIAAVAAEKESTPEGRDRWTSQALERFATGATFDESLTANWYDLYTAGRYSRDPAVVARSKQALYRARESAPANLFLLADTLQALAEDKSDKLAGVLEEARALLQPLARGIQARARVDVNTFLNDALAAVQARKWPEATARVRVLATVTRPEEYAQGDRKRIDPYPLEFVLTEFSPRFTEQAVSSESSVEPIRVRLDPLDMTGAPAAFAGAIDHAVADVNLDGFADVVLLGPGWLKAYSLKGTKQAAKSAVARELFALDELLSAEIPEGFNRLLVSDLDRDKNQGAKPNVTPPQPESGTAGTSAKGPPGCFEAAPDFVLTGPAGVWIALNVPGAGEGSAPRTLQVVAQEAGLADVKDVTLARLVDFDQEGDLDLALVTKTGFAIWSNRGDLQFEDLTGRSSPTLSLAGIDDLVAVDFDRDIDIDLVFVSEQTRTVGLIENLRHGEFRTTRMWDGDVDGDGADWGADGATGCAVLEWDGIPSWDVAVLDGKGLLQATTRTPNRGRVVRHRQERVAVPGLRGLSAGDWNNDGRVDLVLWSEKGLSLSYNNGALAGSNFSLAQPDWVGDVRGLIAADVDGDGDLDLLPRTDHGVSFLRNVGGESQRGMLVRVFGENDAQSGRVNQYNLGGLLELRANGAYQARVISGQTTHFGLGAAETADVLRVLFTNGVPQAVVDAAGPSLCEKQILKGSCPYLYTWNGTEWSFYTDLLWNAPLGLQYREGAVLPDRPWEYLRVEGDRLQPRGGEYELRVTSELWEADYFDQIELLAVDHPADVAVYTNEKVGPAALAEHKLHTVRHPKHPVAATDSRGRDVLAKVRLRDGEYAKCHDVTLLQGITEPQHLELDLGPAPEGGGNGALTLFLTGWMYPTDTSLNVGLTRNPLLAGPKPPSLWVIGPDGEWLEARAFMGFPGGKPKTIAVDLTALFPTADRRLRIATTQELFWDEVFFTEGETPVEVRVRTLALRRAELRYRGFSEVVPRGESTPERIDYGRVSPLPKWPPMGGCFTRYGAVAPLLEAWDDRMVVMSPGDELSLVFEGGEPIPEGWTRTFVLHSVGWDKDADLHTLYGQTAEPLPRREMKSYPFGPDDRLDETPEYADYLRTYQTREMPWGRFGRLESVSE